MKELEARNEQLLQYEKQCNSLSQRFCKSLIAEGVPAALEYIQQLEVQVSELKTEMEKLRKWDGTQFPVVFSLRGLRITVSEE